LNTSLDVKGAPRFAEGTAQVSSVQLLFSRNLASGSKHVVVALERHHEVIGKSHQRTRCRQSSSRTVQCGSAMWRPTVGEDYDVRSTAYNTHPLVRHRGSHCASAAAIKRRWPQRSRLSWTVRAFLRCTARGDDCRQWPACHSGIPSRTISSSTSARVAARRAE
jgi:hypothetical protein